MVPGLITASLFGPPAAQEAELGLNAKLKPHKCDTRPEKGENSYLWELGIPQRDPVQLPLIYLDLNTTIIPSRYQRASQKICIYRIQCLILKLISLFRTTFTSIKGFQARVTVIKMGIFRHKLMFKSGGDKLFYCSIKYFILSGFLKVLLLKDTSEWLKV